MSAPPKPWERPGDVNHRQPTYQPDLTPSFMPSMTQRMPGPGGGSSMPGLMAPPPLPPRPSTVGPFNTFPRPSYGGYGTMGMGMYGGTYRGFGQYGMNGLPEVNDENGFIQLAEDSSRQAFQSIESIVHAFGSVSMMLESTYHAVYSSFRAVLGVADHFNRMKSHFAQIFSALAIVRTLRWLYKKLLFLIGLRSEDPSLEAVWRSANSSLPNASQITEADIKASKSSWPIVLFLGVVFGGPYLIWRLLSSLVPSKANSRRWMTGQEEHYAAVGQFSFQARSKNELSFTAGQPLVLAPKDQQPSYQGWLLASNGRSVGLVPANYIKIHGLRSPLPQQGSNDQKQGNQFMVPRMPSIPFPPQGTQTALVPQSGTGGRNYGTQPGALHLQQRLPPPSQMGEPLNTQRMQRVPLFPTHQGQGSQFNMLQGQGAPPVIQQGQRLPGITQQGQGAPPVIQQGQRLPGITQQGQGAPPVIQQGQRLPGITQQGQEAALVTQHGQGLSGITQQRQGAAPVTQHGQGLPGITQQGQGAPPATHHGQGLQGITQQGQGVSPATQQGQGLPGITQQGQGPSPVIQGSAPNILPPLFQQDRPEGSPFPPQDTPLSPSEGEDTLVTDQTYQPKDEGNDSDTEEESDYSDQE